MDNLRSKDDNNNDNGKAKRKLKNVDHKSAKWSDELRKIFADLAIMEIEKGRHSRSFSIVEWKILVAGFNQQSGLNYDIRQLKNHWDRMKSEWKIFRQLMNKETGFGWDPIKKSIDATEGWWESKIKVLHWFQYNTIVFDVIATGERARAPSQHSGVGLDIHDDDSYKDTYTNDNEERSGDSDDIQNVEMQSSLHASLLGDDYLFPNSSSFKRQKSNEGVSISSPIWNYGCHQLKEKDSRTVFMNQPSDEAQLSFLEVGYQMFFTTRFRTSG
ncbi:hypothetical protein LIER_23030 [Lithospermum erythrorhizon]|uniref:Myb/SANT-like domain-containing protein n=1 Tax=Lithospermum erythrorhizon TaxID=34254 RepID=A0AAV3QW65_LITER